MPMVDCPILQVDITTYWELYSEMFSVTGDANVARSGVMPSSGLLGTPPSLPPRGRLTHRLLRDRIWMTRAAFIHSLIPGVLF